MFEQAREGFVIADRDGRVVTVNQAFCDISGYGADELQGQQVAALGFGIGRRDVRRQVRTALQTSGHWQGEVRTSRKDGSLYTCWAAITQQRDAGGVVTHYIGILNDITQFREVERNLVRLAHVDTLTDLPNRSLLADRVGQLTSVSRRDHRPFALMFMDLDQFKNINDTHGHSIGDALLAEMARRLQGSLREVDTVARLGGDEFAVLLPGADAAGAELVASKLLERLAEPCMVQGHELSMTMSIGIATYPSDGDDYEILSRNADTAMYRAKHEGKATWRFFAAGMQQRSARQLQLESALRRAIERNELLLHYQPQLDAAASSWWAWRRCCAGAIPSSAWCRRPSSFRWPRQRPDRGDRRMGAAHRRRAAEGVDGRRRAADGGGRQPVGRAVPPRGLVNVVTRALTTPACRPGTWSWSSPRA